MPACLFDAYKGACQELFQLTASDVEANISAGRNCSEDSVDLIGGRRLTGAVRASLGASSTTADCDALVRVLRERFVDVCCPEAREVSVCLSH